MGGGEEPWIEEWAKHELQNLESKHPHHFHFLKADLKSYLFSDHPLPDLPPITTQASSNVEHISKGEQEANKRHKLSPDKKNKRKSRTEMVIERAEECLKKIRHLKQSFHWSPYSHVQFYLYFLFQSLMYLHLKQCNLWFIMYKGSHRHVYA